MTLYFEKHPHILTSIGSIVAGLIIYSILSYVLMPQRVIAPLSIIMSLLIFGLAEYYSRPHIDSNRTEDANSSSTNHRQEDIYRTEQTRSRSLSTIFLVTIFGILITISVFANNEERYIFTKWSDVGTIDLIQLATAIMLCFFIPGIAIVLIMTRKYKMNPILAVLLGYFFSILITGLSAYILGVSFDNAISESKSVFISIYLVIIVAFIYYRRNDIFYSFNTRIEYNFRYRFVSIMGNKLWSYLKLRGSQLLVFASLLMLLIISTYCIYDITISDQWFHQGRALLFMSGTFREAAIDSTDTNYPPFQSALLAGLTTLSGVPLVNAYVSIAFLNIIPVFAFYYFFSRWVSPKLYRASTLASCLFAISSGFTWIYFLTLTATSHPISSPHSFLEILNSITTPTIIRPTNFIFSAEPDFSTALIYIALPAGLVLLGLVRETFHSKLHNVIKVAMISTIGILSHDEFFLFIIIASLLPLFFKMKERNYVYLGFILSFVLVFLIDRIIPVSYYTSNAVFGIPLFYLNVFFVLLTWGFYVGIHRFQNFYSTAIPLHEFKLNTSRIKKSGIFAISIIVISFIAYMYVLGYVTFAQLSLADVKADARGYVVPWYLYPTKLGLVGLFGLVFILSYFFKRFEKCLFVFGIIILVAFIAGSYYDEHRFSKFMMLGLIGFASVFIYRILNWNYRNKLVINVVVISAIIICSSLSILMFIGQNSLVEQTQDYTINPKRKFPSATEIQLFDSLRHDLNVASKKFNIVSFPDAYNFTTASPLISKLHGFSGFPYAKLLQSPLTLNASTLDAFYRQLGYSDARYIILLKNSTQVPTVFNQPIRFALEYFKPFYEDSQYIILKVPDFDGPSSSSDTDVALVLKQRDDLLSHNISNLRLLPYNNDTFDFKGKDEFVTVQKNNASLLLNGSKSENGGISLWSKENATGTDVNYIEAKFRITLVNDNKSDQARLKWREGDKEYYVSLSNDGLQLYQQSINNQADKKVFKNTEIIIKPSVWYTLKIESLNNSINVYIDNQSKIQAPKGLAGTNHDNITRIALTSLYNNIEFNSIKIGRVSDHSGGINEKTKYEIYYPLSILALSKAGYDIFLDSDLSALSKNVIIVPDSLKFDNFTFNKYLDYVNAGGNLIVINSNNVFNQTFSRLFPIQINSSSIEPFTSISSIREANASINVPGLISKTHLEPLSDVKVIASYQENHNQTVAPFAIEKAFSNGGRMVLVNAGGYFNSISNSPRQNFLSLSNILKLIGYDSKSVTASPVTSIAKKGFIGSMETSGNTSLNSSSILFANNSIYPSLFNVGRIEIDNKTSAVQNIYDNVTLKSLRPLGHYSVIINSNGRLELPDIGSTLNYISLFMPSEFNMTISLFSQKPIDGYLEMVTQNGSTITVDGRSKVHFYSVRAGDSLESVPILLKNPEIKVNGNTSIKHATFQGYLTKRGDPSKGAPIDIQGELNTRIDNVDDYTYDQPFRNGTRTDFVTFLQWIRMSGAIDSHEGSLKLPAHILEANGQLDTTLVKSISSPSGIVILIVVIVIALIIARILWNRILL